MSSANGYVYLNLANQWPMFTLNGVEIAPHGALRLGSSAGGYVARGVFVAGPFNSPDVNIPWYRLLVESDPLPSGAHVQFFTFAGASSPAYDPTATPFSGPGWLPAPRDVLDLLILNANATQLWIGGILRTENSAATPLLRQMRLQYGRDTYANFLPMLYRRNGSNSDFLERFLSLHQSVLGGIEGEIADLPRLFDPLAAPDGNSPSWLAWLAGWLTFVLDENWVEPQTRKYLAGAFDLFQRRGTIAGLERYIQMYVGVRAHIQEPGLYTSMWSLGEISELGFSTMLAPGPAQGAVLGTSATLNQSNLTEDIDLLGAALFDEVAHRFCIQVYCAELNQPGAMAALQAVIAREKPAHTECHICGIDARMRVGVQSRVGIDSVIAQGPPPAELGRELGTGALGDKSRGCYS